MKFCNRIYVSELFIKHHRYYLVIFLSHNWTKWKNRSTMYCSNVNGYTETLNVIRHKSKIQLDSISLYCLLSYTMCTHTQVYTTLNIKSNYPHLLNASYLCWDIYPTGYTLSLHKAGNDQLIKFCCGPN